ncbi:MAG: hypothetical protein V5A55_13070 [Halovenus sp.]
MTDRRGLLGGLCLIAGALPLLVFYGASSVGYVAGVLAIVGAVISYGAYRV